MKIEIIIVTYNGMQWIDKCLKSVLKSSIHVEIIIIDNCSTDGTLEFIKKEFPEVIIIKNNENLGFGKANNLGMSYAMEQNCDFVFLVNQDVYIEHNTIENLMLQCIIDKSYGVLSPIHLNGDGTNFDKNFSTYMNYDKSKYFYYDMYRGDAKKIYETLFVNAAAWFIPISTLKKIGGFDPIFFHYGEDDNYVQRLKYHNLKIGVVSDSIIYHDRENLIKKRKNLEELVFKMNWANVNNKKAQDLLDKEKSVILKRKKSLIKLKFNEAKSYSTELKFIRSVKGEVINSLTTNVTIGPHYLNKQDE